MASDQKLAAKLEKIRLLEERKKLREGLPHLYGRKLYQWQRDYMDATPEYRHRFLSAANQIGKSSISIIDCIDKATSEKLWKKLWGGKPNYFMYFYPSLKLATREFDTKWIPEFLPRGEFKEHAIYGWEAEYKAGEIKALHFKSGVSVLFMAYSQAAIDLQAASPAAIYIDEEPPAEIMDELFMRIEGPRKGYFSAVMTPTQGQQYFQDIFSRKRMTDAYVQTISMYKCLQYEDGTPGPFTVADIKRREALLATKAQIDMRIHGKFTRAEGLLVPTFDRELCLKEPTAVPKDWLWYSGVDVGGGGASHPASICFVAVAPDFKSGRVVESWRGGHTEVTTSEDILKKYLDLRGDRTMAGEFYDWASKDFHTIAMRAGVPMQPADKSQSTGYNLLGTLFKNGMLTIDDTEMNQDLVQELLNAKVDTPKRHAKDDAIDGCRYAITKIPWDFSGIKAPLFAKRAEGPPKDPRLEAMQSEKLLNRDEIEAEIQAWNDILEVF